MRRGGLVKIEGDTFGIVDRLRQIDADYEVYYNLEHSRYEVHNKGQRGDTLALTVPYAGLDARTENLVRKTRCERRAQLIGEMEENNRQLERMREKEILRRLADKACGG